MTSPRAVDLSVILVSYETRDLLERCLTSVFHGLGELAAEVFVVDNASTDDSAVLVAERFPQVRLQRNDQNVGFARAVNQALAGAAGRHVLLLNSDVEVATDVLPTAVRYLDECEEVGVLGAPVVNPDGSAQRTSVDEPSLWRLLLWVFGKHRVRAFGANQTLERDVEMVAGCFLCARRAAVEQVGPLDEAFYFYGEDADWCRRFRDRGWIVRVVPIGRIVHVKNASGRKLGHRTHLLLADAYVRYHAKHRGPLSARAAWILMAFFHMTRYSFFLVAGLVRSGPRGRCAGHFATLRELPSIWPGSSKRALLRS